MNYFDAAFKTVEVEYVIYSDSDSDRPITGPLLFAGIEFTHIRNCKCKTRYAEF